jgi:BolA protein
VTRSERIRERLQAAFQPVLLEVEDESAQHRGHAGAASGRGHFRVHIVAEAFRGMAPLARHRAVYAALDELMQTEIHALAISARLPDEA